MEIKTKEVKVHFNWIDDEYAEIICPNCNETTTIDIYGNDTCKCGKIYILHQKIWVEERI